MPKLIAPLNDFSAGLNTSINQRDIGDKEFVVGENVDSGVQGRLRCIGKWDILSITEDGTEGEGSAQIIDSYRVSPGYGLHAFNVDKDTAKADIDGGGKYMAIFQPGDAAPTVSLFVDPQVNSSNYVADVILLDSTNLIGSGNATASTKIDYQFIDGSLNIFSRGLEFDPQKWYYNEAGKHYFTHSKGMNNGDENGGNGDMVEYNTTAHHATNNKAGTAREGYTQDKQFVLAPTGGGIIKSADAQPSDLIGSTSNKLTNGTSVNLLIHQWHAGGNDFTGWGKSQTESETYSFYATFVYDGNNESLPKKLGNAAVGGYASGNVGEMNDLTFSVIVKAMDNDDGTILWNDRITSVRIYFHKSSADKDIKYFLGDFPTSTFNAAEDISICLGSAEGNNNLEGYGHVALKGDKTGKGVSAWSGVGVYHKIPPTIFTHAVKSGIRPGTISIECRYKTSVLLNRKLYVGNINQKTKDSPSIAKDYPDRLLKSIANRFDVLPDTEFVDVAIRDGESIIKLASFGNRLLQFKEHTLYVIATAGGEEYLEATFHHRGVKHPNAVTVLPEGVFWVNEFGAFIFGGEGPPINLIDNKIDNNEWADFISNDAITGYYPREKKLMVVGDAGTLLDATESDEIYYYNLLTRSWNLQKNILIEEGDNDRQEITNFVNYVDKEDTMHTLFMCNGATENVPEDEADILEYKNVDELSTVTTVPFSLKTKDFTADVPAQRKKIYGLYITYKGTVAGTGASPTNTQPTVKLYLNIEGNISESITLEGKTTALDFENASDWQTAHYVVASDDKSKVRNVYGVQIEIESAVCSNDFMINDMSLIYTLKTIK